MKGIWYLIKGILFVPFLFVRWGLAASFGLVALFQSMGDGKGWLAGPERFLCGRIALKLYGMKDESL